MDLNVEMIVKKLKGFCNCKSRNFKFGEYKNCLDTSEYQKVCDKLFRLIIFGMYLQRVLESTLSTFDGKRR